MCETIITVFKHLNILYKLFISLFGNIMNSKRHQNDLFDVCKEKTPIFSILSIIASKVQTPRFKETLDTKLCKYPGSLGFKKQT